MAYGYKDPLRKPRPKPTKRPVRPAPMRDNSGQVDIVAYFSQPPQQSTLYTTARIIGALQTRWDVSAQITRFPSSDSKGTKRPVTTTMPLAELQAWCHENDNSDTGGDIGVTARGLFTFHVRSTSSGIGSPLLPISTTVSILDDWFDRWTSALSALTLIQSIVAVFAENKECYQAIVHPDFRANLNWGHLYTDSVLSPLSWNEYVEHVEWHTCGDARESRLRNVQWGHYVGPAMTEKLPQNFDKLYLSFETEHFGVGTQTLQRFPSGGVFVTVSDDPFEVFEEHPEATDIPLVRNAVWLRQQYRAAGIL